MKLRERLRDLEFKVKNNAMLIFNKKLSVCPITTHVPIKSVSKKINKKLIVDKIKLITNFSKFFFTYQIIINWHKFKVIFKVSS